jgi:CBS domain-containing protein
MRRWLVRDVMTRDVVTVDESMSYKKLVEVLTGHAIGAVPVVDHGGLVVGVVSEADLLHKLEFCGPETHIPKLERGRRPTAWTKASASTVKDLMSDRPVVVSPAASITVAARLMDTANVKRLPVVDDAGRLVGILSRRDLLRIYLRDDWQIREDVVTQVLIRTLWNDPSTITVDVNRGVVTLGGTVAARSSALLLVSMVGGVAGVVDVIDDLTDHATGGLAGASASSADLVADRHVM